MQQQDRDSDQNGHSQEKLSVFLTEKGAEIGMSFRVCLLPVNNSVEQILLIIWLELFRTHQRLLASLKNIYHESSKIDPFLQKLLLLKAYEISDLRFFDINSVLSSK